MQKLLEKIPKGQKLIWWFVDHEKPWYIQMASVIGFWCMFYLIFHLGLVTVGAAIFATALVIQTYAHELGHLAVFTAIKIKARILWLFPLGAVTAPVTHEEDERSNKVPTVTAAWFGQAGLIVNTVLIIIGLILFLNPINAYLFAFGAGLSLVAFIVLLNLIPFWQLDGNLIYQNVMASLGVEKGKILALLITILSGIATALGILIHSTIFSGLYAIAIAHLLGWIIFPILLTLAVWRSWKKYAGSQLTLVKMNTRQAVVQAALHSVMFFFAMIVMFGLP
jgi:Zn-dependent protease